MILFKENIITEPLAKIFDIGLKLKKKKPAKDYYK